MLNKADANIFFDYVHITIKNSFIFTISIQTCVNGKNCHTKIFIFPLIFFRKSKAEDREG